MKVLKYFIIFILILLLNLVNGLKVENFYTPTKNDFYPFNPYYPNPTTCKIPYIYKITHSNLGSPTFSIRITNSSFNYQYMYALESINSTTSFINFLYYLDTSGGEFELNVTDINGETFSNNVTVYCNENISPSEYIVENVTGLIYDRVDNSFKAIFKILNAPYNTLVGLCYNNISDISPIIQIPCSFNIFGDTFYQFRMDASLFQGIPESGFVNINITIDNHFSNSNYLDYNIKMDLPNNGDLIKNITYSDTSSGDLSLAGFYSEPIFKLCAMSNSFPSNPFINFDETYEYIPPVYYSNGSYCFLTKFDTYPHTITISALKDTFSYVQIQSNSFKFSQSFKCDGIKVFENNKYIKYTNGIGIQILTVSSNFFTYIEQPLLSQFVESAQIKGFPYGLVNNSKTALSDYAFSFTIIVNLNSSLKYPNDYSLIFSNLFGTYTLSSISYGTQLSPLSEPIVISNFTINHIANDLYNIKFDFNIQRGLSYFKLSIDGGSTYQRYGLEFLNSGDYKNGTIDFFINYFGSSFTPCQLTFQSIADEILNLDFFIPIVYNTEIDLLSSISDLTFQYKEVTLTNQSLTNVVYFNINGTDPNQPIAFLTKNQYENITNWAIYNQTYKMWQATFNMAANILPGNFQYTIALSNENFIRNIFLPSDKQIIIKSDNFDLFGPVVSEIKRFPVDTDNALSSSAITSFGWQFTISEQFNGFSDGYVKVVADDGTSQIVDIKALDKNFGYVSGDIFTGIYNITLWNDASLCISRLWEITEVFLRDTQNLNSTYIRIPISDFFQINDPLQNFFNSRNLLQIDIDCTLLNPEPTSERYPTLSTIQLVNQSNIPIKSINSGIPTTYSVIVSCDINSGLSNDTSVVYLVDHLYRIIESKVSSKVIDGDIVIYTHNIDMNIIGFGYPLGFTINVYGLMGQYNQITGYTASSLLSMGFDGYIESTFSFDYSFIMKSSNLTMLGGDLFLFGRRFTLTKQLFGIIDGVTTKLQFTVYSDSIVKTTIGQLKNSNDIIVYIEQTNSINSNQYSVPIQYADLSNYKTIDGGSPIGPPLPPLTPPPSTIVSSSSSEFLPTNPPQKCQGNPNCGGSKQGVCTSLGCKCISPFVGLACESKTPEIPKPEPNQNEPNTSLIVDDKVLFTGLVSLVSIREIDINNEIVSTYSFGNWTKNNSTISNNIYYYNTTILNNANVNVTLQWFDRDTTVSFADQEFEMYPSTLKYSIDITNYEFKNSLNTIQLIMSAIVQSSKTNDICSSKEFGNTTIDNSNYIKLKLDDTSLYGRFIRRGLVDNKAVSINNILLDSSMNPIGSSTSVQSFIAISIPNFKNNATIDPDFSVLIDNNKVSSSDNNSICSKKSKLTNGQIAGIVVGCVVGVAIVIAATITIIKKRKYSKEMTGIKMKIEQLNNKI